MKRLSIVVMGVVMAFFLMGCGESAEKKVEAAADMEMHAPQAEQAKTGEVKSTEAAQPATEAPAAAPAQ